MASTTTGILCFEVLHREKNKGNDFNLIAGKGETSVEQELQLLGVNVVPTSKYICRKCLGLIKRRVGHRKKLEEISIILRPLQSKRMKRTMYIRRVFQNRFLCLDDYLNIPLFFASVCLEYCFSWVAHSSLPWGHLQGFLPLGNHSKIIHGFCHAKNVM